jgi:integration host factor subunit alpha
MSQEEAAKVLDWIVTLFKPTVQRGKPIAIAGFGTFRGRNPRTGQETMIAARRVVTFHASPAFKAAVNAAREDSKVR